MTSGRKQMAELREAGKAGLRPTAASLSTVVSVPAARLNGAVPTVLPGGSDYAPLTNDDTETQK